MRHPKQITLQAGDARVTLLDLGCITQDIRLHAQHGTRHMILGFSDPDSYLVADGYLGAIVGRVANRTRDGHFRLGDASFQLDRNDGRHHLHGGQRGLARTFWNVEPDGTSRARFTCTSEDLEMGYPGQVAFAITVTLTEIPGGARLIYEMSGRPDRATPINLAQHNYWSLGPPGSGTVFDHILHVPAGHYLPTDEELIPTGHRVDVSNTRNDFTRPRSLASADPARTGHDVCLCLDGSAITLSHPKGGRIVMHTDQPGAQIYSAAGLVPQGPPLPDQTHQPFHGMCIEPQGWPDALNHPDFPSIIASPEQPYFQRLMIDMFAAA